MKKNVLLVAVALFMSLSSTGIAKANDVQVSVSDSVSLASSQDDGFTVIDPLKLPEGVTKALVASYKDFKIKEAAFAETELGKVYKVILVSPDSKEVTILFNDKGEELKEEA